MNKRFIALSLVMFAVQCYATPVTQAVKATTEVAARVGMSLSKKLLIGTTGAVVAAGVGRTVYVADQLNYDATTTFDVIRADVTELPTSTQRAFNDATQAVRDWKKNLDSTKKD